MSKPRTAPSLFPRELPPAAKQYLSASAAAEKIAAEVNIKKRQVYPTHTCPLPLSQPTPSPIYTSQPMRQPLTATAFALCAVLFSLCSQLIDYDRKRHELMQALAAFREKPGRKSSVSSAAGNTWTCMGPFFLQLPTQQVHDMLNKGPPRCCTSPSAVRSSSTTDATSGCSPATAACDTVRPRTDRCGDGGGAR